MSPELKQFLQKWLEDATSDNPSREVMSDGLCVCCPWRVFDEMKRLFISEDLDASLPFNADIDEYFSEAQNATMHLNPARLAWVRKQLESNQCADL